MAPPVPPRTKPLEKSFLIGPCEVPSSSSTPTEAVYEDIDSLKTGPIERSPSLTGTAKPRPLPRSKSCPRPARPPHSPATNKRLSSCGSTTAVNGSHHYSSTTAQTLETTYIDERRRSPSPLPPPRPPPPSSYLAPSEYKRGLTHQYVNTGESGAPPPQRPQKPLPPPPPPQFTPPPPPPPPRPVSRPVWYSSGTYDTQALYAEIEYPPYLALLPDENDNRIKPSNSTYKQYMGLERARTPPPPPTGPRYLNSDFPLHQEEDVDSLLRWMKTMAYSNNMAPSLYGCNIEDETREFNQRAADMRKALRLYNLLLIQRNATLRGLIAQLHGISDSVDKAQKKTKTMGIAGGATGAVGGVAAVVGIALAPVTMGASLVATAVGAGMVASAGGMGAQAAIARKKCVERRTVEKIVQDYRACAGDVECCAALLHAGMDELRRHDLCRLHHAGAQPEALRMAQLAQTAYDATAAHIIGGGGVSSSERLLQSFAKEMDLYFTEKDGQRLSRSAECKFMSRVRLLAQDLQGVLDGLNQMWKKFSIV